MKLVKCSLPLVLSLLIVALSGCANKNTTNDVEQLPEKETTTPVEEVAAPLPPPEPEQLPVRFQTPGFITAEEELDGELGDEGSEEYQIKVGATIRSTAGPQPLWDILNRLAGLKSMSVSWASDVDNNVLVDVNIAADDDYFTAIDNLLRQVEYYQEVEDNTLVIKYRDTRKFYLSIPSMKGSYTTTTGGNFLTDRAAATGTEGTVKITSDNNEFDVWTNVRVNLDMIMRQWSTTVAEAITTQSEETAEDGESVTAQATRRVTTGDSYYTVDQSIGLITVTAPRPLLDKVELYIETLKDEIYRQVVIEAKIIEVFLQDNSKIGLDWSAVLKDFNVDGDINFGNFGQIYPDSGGFISSITLDGIDFSAMLNALNEQGDAHVLSNPKLTVLNGQPALISVGKDITYISSVERDVKSNANAPDTITYTVESDSIVEGVALGVVANIVDDEKVVLHLTPITTELVDGEIPTESIDGAVEIGLPQITVREMSTMVEVENGEMLIIGGLIDEVESSEEAFAPVVGEIPVVKYLFGYEEKKKERRELVILLTPRII